MQATAERRRALARIERAVFLERIVPEPILTVSEWADRNRMLSPEASAEPGPWRTERAPYLRGVMDAFSEIGIEMVVVMSSSQIGKTEVVLNVVGYFIDQDPAPILVVQPNEKPMGHAFSKDRLAPMLRDSPALQGLVAPVKSRDSGNTILHKSFRGGHLTIVGANSPAGLASRPVRVALFDEVDRYGHSAGTEGDPVTLGMRRTATFWNRKTGLFSTPGVRGFSRIEEAFEEGDQRRYHVPCPHCGQRQILVWRGLKWESNRPETAAYVCGAGEGGGCGALIAEEDKGRMLADGEWIAEHPGRRIASFHLNALYSPWARWDELVREFLEAKGNPERLKAFVNTMLGETWEEQGDQVEAHALRHRAEEYAAEVPAGVGLLTAAVDVQGDRLEWKVKGWGVGEESWLIDWGQFWGDPGRPEVWANVMELLGRRFQHERGAILQIWSMMIDSGGHHTEEVYRFVKPLQGRRVHALKGLAGEGRPLVGRPSKANRHGVKLMPVGVDSAKDTIFSRLRITEPGPGYVHLPSWVDDEYLEQLTAEKIVTRYHRGRPRREYQKTRTRNEALDLEVYCLAALAVLGPAVLASLGSLVERANQAPEAEAERPAAGPRRAGGWVGRWRQ